MMIKLEIQHGQGAYLIKEAIEDCEMFSRIGREDASSRPSSRHVKEFRLVPQGIFR